MAGARKGSRSRTSSKRKTPTKRRRVSERTRRARARYTPFCRSQYPGKCAHTTDPWEHDPYACRFNYRKGSCSSRFRDVDPYDPYYDPYDPLGRLSGASAGEPYDPADVADETYWPYGPYPEEQRRKFHAPS